jgi:hypothetical protein
MLDRALDPACVRGFNARAVREVDAGSCEQSGVRQSVAGIVVGEKNRCISEGAPAREKSPFGANLRGRQGQFWGQSWGQSAGA